MPRRTVAAALLAIACGLLAPHAAQACSCAQRDQADLLRRGEPAVVGTVVDAQQLDGDRYWAFDPTYRYRVRIERAANADFGAQVEIEAGSHGAACGIRWEVGERVGAFLYREGPSWSTTSCSAADPDRLTAAIDRLDGGLRARLGRATVVAVPRSSTPLERLPATPGARIVLRFDDPVTAVATALGQASGKRIGRLRAASALGAGKRRWRATLPQTLPRRTDRLLVRVDRGGRRETLAVGLTLASRQETAAPARAGRDCPGRAWAAAPSALL